MASTVNFKHILDLLHEHQVAYIIVGGAAMVIQGSSYTTEDFDVLYERSTSNCGRLAAALREMNPRLRVEGIAEGLAAHLDATAIRNGSSFTLTTDFGDFDILGQIDGVGKYEDALQYVDRFELSDGRETQVLSIEGLIVAKRGAGRPKDLAALPELEAMRELGDSEDRRKNRRS